MIRTSTCWLASVPAENELMALKEKIGEIVGETYRFALFYNFLGSLRFELSSGDSPLDQVLTALRRATVICDDVFNGQAQILVHLETYTLVSRFSCRKTLRELRLAGIVIPKARDVWVDLPDDDDDHDDRESWHWLNCAFEVPVTKLQNLLWCALATDFAPLRPNPHCRVYLINASKGLICHPYDDRGMDVIGCRKLNLGELYTRYGDWLLKYDLDAMRETFGHSSTMLRTDGP